MLSLRPSVKLSRKKLLSEAAAKIEIFPLSLKTEVKTSLYPSLINLFLAIFMFCQIVSSFSCCSIFGKTGSILS